MLQIDLFLVDEVKESVKSQSNSKIDSSDRYRQNSCSQECLQRRPEAFEQNRGSQQVKNHHGPRCKQIIDHHYITYKRLGPGNIDLPISLPYSKLSVYRAIKLNFQMLKDAFSPSLRTLLRILQFFPGLILYYCIKDQHDRHYARAGIFIQAFYLIVSFIVVRCSKFGQVDPFLLNQLRNLKGQFYKGVSLGLSAFLLITIYSAFILRYKKLIPEKIDLGQDSHEPWLCLGVMLINPLLEEWFWRILLAKALCQDQGLDTFINFTAYLWLHLVLFSQLLGPWRALPLTGTFFSIGRSMKYIKERYGIVSGVVTHYGITLGGMAVVYSLRERVT